MENKQLVTLALEVMKLLIKQYRGGFLDYCEFVKHTGLKAKFIRSNMDFFEGAEKASAINTLNVYEDLASGTRLCI